MCSMSLSALVLFCRGRHSHLCLVVHGQYGAVPALLITPSTFHVPALLITPSSFQVPALLITPPTPHGVVHKRCCLKLVLLLHYQFLRQATHHDDVSQLCSLPFRRHRTSWLLLVPRQHGQVAVRCQTRLD